MNENLISNSFIVGFVLKMEKKKEEKKGKM